MSESAGRARQRLEARVVRQRAPVLACSRARRRCPVPIAITRAIATTSSQRRRRSRARTTAARGAGRHRPLTSAGRRSSAGPPGGGPSRDDAAAGELDHAVGDPGDLAVVGHDEHGRPGRGSARAAARGSARRCGSRARRSARRRAGSGCRSRARGRSRRAAARRRRARGGSGRSRSPSPTRVEHLAARPRRGRRGRATSAPNCDVLERGQAGEQVEGLEDEADTVLPAERGQFACATRRVMSRPGDGDRALGRRVERADQVEQRRLAAARRAEHDDELAGLDGEVHAPRARSPWSRRRV